MDNYKPLQPLEYTLKCSQLISSSNNKKILLTTRNVRLDSGLYAIKYYLPLLTLSRIWKKKCKNVNFSSSDDNDETLGDDDAIDQADVVDPEAGANQNNDNNPTTNLQTLDTANANSIDFRNVTDNDNNIPVSGYILFLFQFLI